MGRGVAAHHARRAPVQLERFEQRPGQPRMLVGDDAPAHTEPLQGPQHRLDPRKQAGTDRDALAVPCEEPASRTVELSPIGVRREHARDHLPGAPRDQGPQPRLVHRAHAGGRGERVGEVG